MQGPVCPYLGTIRKNQLDFDFEKICSLSLAKTNIYACLVCGRYLQGRSASSPAYQHSIEACHYIYMNLQTARIYCLPDDYEVDAYTLKDVQFNLRPVYTLEMLQELEKGQVEYNVDGREFVPGVMGANNLGRTDYAMAVVYLLNAVREIRRFFVLNWEFESRLLSEFSSLLRKIWNPKSFKGVVSPHQFLQEVSEHSQKKFKIGASADPLAFFLWLRDALAKELKKEPKAKQYRQQLQLQSLFQGKLKTSLFKPIKQSHQYEPNPCKVQQLPFSLLRLQFPQKCIFNQNQSPVPLQSLLLKYQAKSSHATVEGLHYYLLTCAPAYLLLHYHRFLHTGYAMEKNTTPVDYQHKLSLTIEGRMHVYELVGQVCHQGEWEAGAFRVQVPAGQAAEGWHEVEDLQVRALGLRELLLAEPYLQLYRLQRCDPS